MPQNPLSRPYFFDISRIDDIDVKQWNGHLYINCIDIAKAEIKPFTSCWQWDDGWCIDIKWDAVPGARADRLRLPGYYYKVQWHKHYQIKPQRCFALLSWACINRLTGGIDIDVRKWTWRFNFLAYYSQVTEERMSGALYTTYKQLGHRYGEKNWVIPCHHHDHQTTSRPPSTINKQDWLAVAAAPLYLKIKCSKERTITTSTTTTSCAACYSTCYWLEIEWLTFFVYPPNK